MNLLQKACVCLFLAMVCNVSYAGPGDTTWVQTYTFEEQNDPETAYESPGRRWFDMPASDGTTYQKILMYYTLKCFEDGTAGNLGFPCGEWDYLTYNYLYDHTGVLDSLDLTHPQFLLDNQDFEMIDYLTTPIYNSQAIEFYYGEVMSVMNETIASIEIEESSEAQVIPEAQEGRFQYLYTADELSSAGLVAGDIHQISFHVNSGQADLSSFLVRAKTSNEVALMVMEDDGFIDGQLSSMSFDGEEWVTISFVNPINWDGLTSIVIDFVSEGVESAETVLVAGSATTDKGLQVVGVNRYMDFEWYDEVKVPVEAFSTIDEQVTIAFWFKGDEDLQPLNSTIFEGVDENNNRVMNSHLPWGNGRIYWDAGWDGGYDRIDNQATATLYEGNWNHIAFTKNTTTEVMNIYVNGSLWHTGTDKDNPLSGVVDFSIGGATSGTRFYEGSIDEFAIWNVELSEETIAEWMNKTITTDHPNYSDLQVYYEFNNENGMPVEDASSFDLDGWIQGSPGRFNHNQSEFALNAVATNFRPDIRFHQGDFEISEVVETVYEDVPVPPMSLIEYEVDGYNVAIANNQSVWLAGYTYTFDVDGEIIDSTATTPEIELFENSILSYTGAPFEVVDRYEIGRYITPYGINLTLDDDGWTWIFDVTDYDPLLRDSIDIAAGNWQELLDMKFAFIEGTPPRDVQRVENIWSGSIGLSTFDDVVTDVTLDVLEGEENFRLKTRASGHGFGTGANCAEFCFNNHKVEVNGTEQWNWQIMQECSDNPLYPQGGTWIYDRAAWCPGDVVTTQDFELTPLIDGDQFTVDYDIDYDPYGNYVFEGQLITYGEHNFVNDVELDQILAPSDFKLNSRINPICDDPVVRIKNNGSATLTSCTIEYGMNGNMESYTWEGSLEFGQTEDVTLSYGDPTLWGAAEEVLHDFTISVSNPNGVMDGNEFNNTGHSRFYVPPVYTYGEGDDDDNRVIVWMKTNLAYWENSVEISDVNGNVVWSRDDYNEANTIFRDTIQLNAGCYLLHLMDSGQDGLDFFANNDGNGYLRLKKVAGSTLINFENDFGMEIKHHFNFVTDLVSTEEFIIEDASLNVYPNPTNGDVFAQVKGLGRELNFRIIDSNGRTVDSGVFKNVNDNQNLKLTLRDQASGIYLIQFFNEEKMVTRRVNKL